MAAVASFMATIAASAALVHAPGMGIFAPPAPAVPVPPVPALLPPAALVPAAALPPADVVLPAVPLPPVLLVPAFPDVSGGGAELLELQAATAKRAAESAIRSSIDMLRRSHAGSRRVKRGHLRPIPRRPRSTLRAAAMGLVSPIGGKAAASMSAVNSAPSMLNDA